MVQPPARPSEWQERAGLRLFRSLAPQVPPVERAPVPPKLLPFQSLAIRRSYGPGILAATWFPAYLTPRGAVLLLHPWVPRASAYFHRHGRIEALRAAGYHVLTVDFPGFGGSDRPAGLYDRAVDDALAMLDHKSEGLDLFVWGVSTGGYWAHPALARTDRVAGAMFEDVPTHPLEWSSRVVPWGRPLFLFFSRMLPEVDRYLDARRHAAALDLGAVTYISGSHDAGVRSEETRELAGLAGGSYSIVRGADHLASIDLANRAVIRTALETLERGAQNSSTAAVRVEDDDSQISAVG